MIRNDRQYRILRARVERLTRLAADLEEQLARPPPDPARVELELRAVRGEAARIRQEIEEYEALRAGRAPVGELRHLEDLPRLLVRARIAAGLTQAQLAEKLGLKEQQIQRYEATDYEGASLSRLVEVARALGLELVPGAATPPPSFEDLAEAMEAAGIDREVLRKRIGPPALRAGRQDAATLLSLGARLARIFGRDPAGLLAWSSELRHGAYVAYARYLASLTLVATPHLEPQPVPEVPGLLRLWLQERGGLALEGALACSWDLGVPVLPLADRSGFHAAYWRSGGRGVIVLKPGHGSRALWLFDLLHQLAHAAQAPREPELEVVDPAPGGHREGAEELADRFAAEVLLGEAAPKLLDRMRDDLRSGGPPARTVEAVAAEQGVDPALLAACLAHGPSRPGIDPAELERFEPPGADPWETCRDTYLSHTDLSRLEPLDRELLLQALAEAPDRLAARAAPASPGA